MNHQVSTVCHKCRGPLGGEAIFCGNCGAALIIANRYEILDEIKSGAMGCVYRARDRSRNAVVALKHLTPVISDADNLSYAVNRFKEEGQILSRLRHSGLPQVFDSFSIPDSLTGAASYFLVMSYIDGKDLEEIISGQKKGPFPLPQALDYLMQFLNVFNYLHSQNPPVIYRDLKPSNVMVQKGRILLVDFGVAKIFAIEKGTAIGTPGYAAPEQYKGYADQRSDIFSLGVLMHYLLTGQDPEGSGRQPFSFEKITKFNRSVPVNIEELVMSMLEVVPDKRPGSIAEIKRLLNSSRKRLLDRRASLWEKGGNISSPQLEQPGYAGNRKSGASYESHVNIFVALKKKDYSAVRAFIDGDVDVNECDEDGRALLYLAIMCGNMELAQFFIDRGADVFSTDRDGWTPMHYAARTGSREMAELLIYHGSRVNDLDKYGSSPLDLAIQYEHTDIMRFLISCPLPENLRGYEKILKAIEKHGGADPCCMIMEFLAGAGENGYANVETLFHSLIYRMHKQLMDTHNEEQVADIVWMDVVRGSSPVNRFPREQNSRQKPGYPLLSGKFIKILIDLGCNVNGIDRDGLTPLHLSVKFGFYDVAKLLIRNRASVNVRDNEGWTPLHYAVYRNNKKIMELLLNSFASVWIVDDSGRTPRDLALERGYEELAKRLLNPFKYSGRNLPPPYRERPSNEQLWRKAYDRSFYVADHVLYLFCLGFEFRQEDRDKFLPEDKFIDIYGAKYPNGFSFGVVDHMEFEEFTIGIEAEFPDTFTDSDYEKILTFDDIIKFIINSRRSK